MENFRTDLAVERRDIYRKANKLENEIEGMETEEEQISEEVKVTRVKVTSGKGEEAIGKPKGSYITIDVRNLKIATEEEIEQAAEVLAKELKILIDSHAQNKEDILVVGLGNIYVTPDALGPKVVNEIDITRHLIEYLPQYVDESTRPVSAISPGVLGTTGIETLEILKGIVDNIHPKLLIVIDSLASRSIERISSTIQLADTGIIPGAGVGNKRKELTKETLGVPVLAIGVPTVVEAATIAADSLDMFIKQAKVELEKEEKQTQGYEKLYEVLNNLTEENRYEMIKEALIPGEYNFIVTPKEIDELIENMAGVVARGINKAV